MLARRVRVSRFAQILRPSPFLEVSPYRAHASRPLPEEENSFSKASMRLRSSGRRLNMAELFNQSLLSMAGHLEIGDSDLSRQNHAAADFRTSCQTHLRAKQRIFTNVGGVTDLHEVVDFCAAADACFADGGTVDCGVGADFDVIFENDNSGLNDFVIRAVVLLGISEPIGTDLRPILKNDVVAKHAKLANGDMGVGLEVVANTNTAADMDKGVNRTVASNPNVVLDHHIRADGSSFSYLC